MSVKSFPTFASIKADGESLGLTGDDLRVFITEQQNLARDERARDRELEQLKLETEVTKAKIEADERSAIRQHELETIRLNSNANHPASSEIRRFSHKPKLPEFRDGDDMNSFLVRFERIATLLEMEESAYVIHLGSSLTGRALEIFASLSDEITGDYKSLKSALLSGFNRNAEVYRSEFRSMRISSQETYEQFAIKLGRTLDYWIESKNVEHDYGKLREFIIADQFIAAASPELRIFLKEHNTFTIKEMTKLADNWSTAHSAYPKAKPKFKLDEYKNLNTEISRGTTDHKITNDNFEKKLDPPPPVSQPSIYPPRSNVKCYSCGATGHIKSRCPTNPDLNSNANPQIVGFCFHDRPTDKFLVSGTVNSANVSTVIRDTGCSCVIVSDLVLPNVDLSNAKKVDIYDYLGRKNTFPVIRCYIRCAYYVGWVDAVRAPIRFCSVLIGNVPGVIDDSSANMSRSVLCEPVIPSQSESCDESIPMDGGFAATAITRAAARPKVLHPLVVPQLDPVKISPNEFKQLQKTCPTLKEIREKCQKGEITTLRDGSKYSFIRKNDLIYRKCLKSKFVPKIGKVTLVVPEKCRKSIMSVAHEALLAGHFSHRKTEARVRENFFWPRMGTDVRNYCRSCDRCERFSKTRRV